MPDRPHTHESRAERRRQVRWYLPAVAWTAAAIVVPFASLFNVTYSVAEVQLCIVLFIANVVLSNLSFQFTATGDPPLSYSPDSQALILAAIVLPPPLAMVAAAGVAIDFNSDYRTPLWKQAFVIGTSMAATGLVAGVISFIPVSLPPSAMLLLPIAVVASVVFELVQAIMYSTMFEAKERGGGRRFAQSLRNLSPANIVINTLAVVLVAPFISSWLAMLVVFASFQVLTFLASKLSTSENLHREKSAHLRDVFGRYVPSHVADQLEESGQEIRLGGEQREITVLFVDIRGFTSWAETADAEVVITQLNGLLGSLSDAVMQADGTLDKYTGDGLMAFWGAPLEQPDHAERAWTAGIDMLMRLRDFNRERAVEGLPRFDVGIGIHTGVAVVGNVGSEQRLDYTAIGDTVNTAARVEAATKDVGLPLLITEATWQALPLDRRRSADQVGEVMVKGKRLPITVYSLPRVLTQDVGDAA